MRLDSPLLSIALGLLACGASDAGAFRFDSSSSPINGQSAGDVIDEDGLTMSVATVSDGATFWTEPSGMGIDSRGVAGATDGEPDKFNLPGGALDGQTEAIVFSFDHRGVITTLDFDGVKDESFEYFQLVLPGGEVLTIFDQQIGLRLLDVSLIDLPNLTLLTEEGPADDDLFGLSIPYEAGEEFRLLYGEYLPEPSNLVPGFTPQQGNGARFEGLSVVRVPEPVSLLPALLVAGSAGISSRRRTA